MRSSSWYKEWFDSPYYHILYQHRDENEARHFIENLLGHLQLPAQSNVLDLACGRGRHARKLHEHGMVVTGIDLSSCNIQYAKQFETTGLKFLVADMRESLGTDTYYCIFNLFTSFGYFSNPGDNQKAMEVIAQALEPGGKLVLDFMNVTKVVPDLVHEETKTIKGIPFRLQRYAADGFVIKDIQFNDNGQQHHFQEKVRMLTLEDFLSLLTQSGLHNIEVFGDFELGPYHSETSERLILIAQKP